MRSRRLAGLGTLITTVSTLGCATVPTADHATEEGPIVSRVHQLLDAYAADDQQAVFQLIDPNGFVFYGSDLSEVVHTPAELRQLMNDDFALWREAHFGAPADLDIRVGAELATAYFNVPFTAGHNPPVTVRLATTWHRVKGQWLLAQAATALPTRGSSARELLHR